MSAVWLALAVGAATWLMLAVIVAVAVGRVIRRRDEQAPTTDLDDLEALWAAVSEPKP